LSDIVCDVSVRDEPDPIWRQVVRSGTCIAAGLPVYSHRDRYRGIDRGALLATAEEMLEGGVGLLTIHATPTHEIVALAETRIVPWTSRGGGLIIEDLLRGNSSMNAYEETLGELVLLAQRHGGVLSLGASFRSATVFDSADQCQMAEIDRQLTLAHEIRDAGVDVVIESPGHARPSDLKTIAGRLRPAGFPVMPLGPIPTDAAIGEDHISSAIGATLFGLAGCASIIAAVTREEHTGGVPTLASTVEAIRAARVAAHVIDLELLGNDSADREIALERSAAHTCVAGRAGRGCARCGPTCPL
jgi:phosphomethylpyrimidine synthase